MNRWTVCLSLVALLGGGAAGACTYAQPPIHEVDPAEALVDVQAPGQVAGRVVRVQRGRSRLLLKSSCDDLGIIEIEIDAAEDDRTAPDELGYRLELSAGRLPRGLNLPPDAIRVGPDRRVLLVWPDRGPRRKVDFQLTVQAVDKAGNAGPPSESIPVTN